jgi:glycosyltransferase involved in cell wall biosynthesis
VSTQPLTVAWISDFPVEWLPDAPELLLALPRRHPATWQMVLLSEFEKDPSLRLHILLMRWRIPRDLVFQRNGVTFHVLKAPVSLRLGSLFWWDTILLRRSCRAIQPDLVHAWGIEKGAAAIAQRFPYPYVMTVQGLLGWYKQHVPLGKYYWLMERFERATLPRAPVVTTESSFAVKFLKERYPHLRVHQAEHAPNHVFRAVQRKPQTRPLLSFCVSGVDHRKGSDILLKSLDQLRHEVPFKLTIIAGPDTPYVSQLRASVSDALWQQIEFRRHIPPSEVAAQLAKATLVLLPTRVDTSPNSVKEAVVAGVPVVASEIGGIPDYVFPGKNGLLSPPGDQAAFLQALRQACAHPLFGEGKVDPETHARVRDYLSPERMATNFLGAYRAAVTVPRR